jgi:hypothetical protein
MAGQDDVIARDVILSPTGGLAANFYTAYVLDGPALEVFKACIQDLDESWNNLVYSQKAWRAVIKSSKLAQLSMDDKYRLLSEVGLARLITRLPGNVYDMQFFQELVQVLKPIQADAELKCQIEAILELMHGRYEEGRQQLSTANGHYKACAKMAGSLTRPELVGPGLAAQAWASAGSCFGMAGQDGVALKCQRKAIKLYHQSTASRGLRLAVQNTVTELLILVEGETFPIFLGEVRKAFANLTVANASDTLDWLQAFSMVLSLEDPCCFAPALHNQPCSTHGLKYPTRAFPLELERVFDNPLENARSADRAFWHEFNACRVSRIQGFSEMVDIRSLHLRLAMQSQFKAAIDDYLDGTEYLSKVAADNCFQLSLQTLLQMESERFHDEVKRDLTADESAMIQTQLAVEKSQFDEYLKGRGLSLTTDDILSKYKGLDKNLSRKLADSKLLPLLIEKPIVE